MTMSRSLTIRCCLGALTASLAIAAPAGAEFGLSGPSIGGGQGKAVGQFGTGRPTVAEGGDRQFDDPDGLAVDAAGVIYAADASNHRVERFGADGKPRGFFGKHGFDPGAKRSVGGIGRLNLPMGLALDGHGSIYVADNRNDRITKWSTAGRWQARIGRRGSAPGTLTSPWGVAVHGTTVFVLDQANQRVSKFTTSGKYLGSFGRGGEGRGQLQNPFGIAISPLGIIYVSDSSKDEILRYSLSGHYLGSFGTTGIGNGQFQRATGIAVQPGTNQVFISDYCNQRIERFDPNGNFLGQFGSESLATPTFMAFAPSGTLYVSDYDRILQFRDTGVATAAAAQTHVAPLAKPATFNLGTAFCYEA
jgi:DNA-binding beta-propeller fold protein YncE